MKAIDYVAEREVVIAVDSSNMGVGYILMQEGEDGRRYPSRFGSITWNEQERKYSQAKAELYGYTSSEYRSSLWRWTPNSSKE